MQHAGTELMRQFYKDYLEDFTPAERMAGLTVEERLEGISTEKRLEGVSLEERLAGLTPEQRAQLAELLRRQ